MKVLGVVAGLLLLAVAGGIVLTRTASVPPPPAALQEAWDEYGYQAWKNAARLFAGVEAAATATPEEKLQARFGLALIRQYQMPGQDPEGAVSLHKQLLDEVPADSPLRVAVLEELGSCYLDKPAANVAKARDYFRMALAEAPPGSFAAQDAALRLLASYMRRANRADFQEGLKVADDLLPQLKGGKLESVAHGLAAQLAYSNGDLPRFAAELQAQEKAGIENRSIRGRVLFQIARVSEVEFKDYKKAEQFYRRLHDEMPSSDQAYFAGLRADELARGKINSDYEPPLEPAAAVPSASVAPVEVR